MAGLSGPGGEEDLAGDPSTGVAQGNGDHDDVVEVADNGDDFGDQVDWGGDPQSGDHHGDLGAARTADMWRDTDLKTELAVDTSTGPRSRNAFGRGRVSELE
jgi:hypothetical protein